MEDLGKLFEKKLNQYGIRKQVNAAMVCDAFNKAVKEAFGDTGHENVWAISFKEDVLKVGVTSSSWASEISLRQLELKNQNKMRFVYEVGEKKL